MEKEVGFLTFEMFQGKQNIGSTRIRVRWPIAFWPEAEEYRMGRRYETVVFQKAYYLEGIKHLEEYAPGKHIKILDICDADWLHWGYRIKEVIDNCDAVTTSTIAQAEYLVQLTDKPVWCIPDRLNFEEFGDLEKDHKGRGDAKIAAWFGYSENFPMLDMAINSLITNGFEELIVIANQKHPYRIPAGMRGKIKLTNLPWTAETVWRDLLKADIVVNPQSKKGRWKYKSNNKTISSWALGMPVAHNEQEMKQFISEDERVREGEYRYNFVRKEYDVKKSVEEFKNLIGELKAEKGIL